MTVLSAIVANWCSLQQRGVNKCIRNQPETGPDQPGLPDFIDKIWNIYDITTNETARIFGVWQQRLLVEPLGKGARDVTIS